MKETPSYTLQDIFREGFNKAPTKFKSNTSRAYWSFLSFTNGILFPKVEQLTDDDIKHLNGFFAVKNQRNPHSLAEAIDFALKTYTNLTPESLNKIVGQESSSELHELIPDSNCSTESEAISNTILSDLESKCDKLPNAQRLTVEKRYFEDYSQAEIGRMRGITRESVGQNERKALNKLSSDSYIQSLKVEYTQTP